MIEKPKLHDPVLIEGLPGIGFVANIAALHLISELKARKFCEIHSPAFQTFALIVEDGFIRPPINELYYFHNPSLQHDVIVLYGNTQALNAPGQYELCDTVLKIAEGLGCRSVITIGGLKREYAPTAPKIYCAATDVETFSEVKNLGANMIQGRIFGAAGILLGLAKLMEMRGFCILSETSGLYPDALAAKVALEFLSKFLNITIDFSRLNLAVEATRKLLGRLLIEGPRKNEFIG